MRYTVLIYEDTSERLFGAVVPELPGCVSQGDTVDEALANIREAIEGHLAAMAAHGEDIPCEATPPIIATVEVEASLVARAES
jgi:predicted RNase H-like HicB family nuclease